MVSGASPVIPSAVSQSSTFDRDSQLYQAERAIDDDVSTFSHTECAWNTALWYKMKFGAVYCFSDVVIINSHFNENSPRMDDMQVLVVNAGKRTESLCGVLKVGDALTMEGQTYRIPCNLKCGDEVKLTLRHDSGKYAMLACIHMMEITLFHTGSFLDLLVNPCPFQGIKLSGDNTLKF